MTSTPDLGALVAPLIDLARAAGKAALVHYGPGGAARAKRDGSPVTDADEASEAVILAGLALLTPGIPVVSEERIAAGHDPFAPGGVPRQFWLVDPLDGTKEFVARNGEFAVNIGLVEDGYPVFGLLYGPVRDEIWCSDGRGRAFRTDASGARTPIAARRAPPSGVIVVASRSHGNMPAVEAFLEDHVVAGRRILGSALKFAVLASGEADLYPRFGPTSEWDSCAGQAILEQAGGTVLTLSGTRLAYGKPGFRNPDFIARGR
jgi:3'(2'), 5'-bisphosphate nucleotidase